MISLGKTIVVEVILWLGVIEGVARLRRVCRVLCRVCEDPILWAYLTKCGNPLCASLSVCYYLRAKAPALRWVSTVSTSAVLSQSGDSGLLGGGKDGSLLYLDCKTGRETQVFVTSTPEGLPPLHGGAVCAFGSVFLQFGGFETPEMQRCHNHLIQLSFQEPLRRAQKTVWRCGSDDEGPCRRANARLFAHHHELLVLGGSNTAAMSLTDLWVLDTKTKQWAQIPADPFTLLQVSLATACLALHTLVAFSEDFLTTWTCNVVTRVCKTFRFAPQAFVPQSRILCHTQACQGTIVLAGGVPGSRQPGHYGGELWMFDTKKVESDSIEWKAVTSGVLPARVSKTHYSVGTHTLTIFHK